MNFLLITVVILLTLGLSQALSSHDYSRLDCTFESELDQKPTRCGYKRGWDGMLRAIWKTVNVTRDRKIRTTNGYFAYFEAGRRPPKYSSRLMSPIVSLYDDMCVSFYYVNKGIKEPFPKGRSKLQVHFTEDGRSLKKEEEPLWSSTERTSGNRWKKVTVALTKTHIREKVRGRLIFTAVGGSSKKAYIAIDRIKVHKCKGKTEKKDDKTKISASSTVANPDDFMRFLAAHRPVQTRKFTGQLSFATGSEISTAPQSPTPKKRGKQKSRGRRRKKGKTGKKKDNYGVVYLTEQPGQSEPEEPFVPTVILQPPRPEVLCNFMEYTQGLKICLRAYFSKLKQHRSRNKCNTHYDTLEKCLQAAATKCVPKNDMTKEQVEEVVSDTLRNKFKTQQVYCLEEGAFVFPEFSLGTLPLQCTREYFQQLTQCGGSFAGLFNFKHGDQNLCREYFRANECQRRTTAVQCNFDSRSMLIYGLNLQYQFAHNPFCIDLPFSAWWPAS